MATRSERSDTHYTDLRGVRVLTTKPYLFNTDATDTEFHAIGAIAYNSATEILYINTTGTIYGWRSRSLT